MKKSFIILALALLLACVLCVGVSADFDRTREYKDGQFKDVPADAWYAKTVADCYELGLINGSSATTYNPQGFFTLAEASTIAARMHEIYNGGDGVIPAASGEWYQGAVNYCIANGIIEKGEYNNFKKNATRAEMAKIMYNALPKSEWKAINSLTSLPDVDENTKNGEIIFALYKAGIFTGSDAYGKFQPHAAITRAEVSALVARMADVSQRKTLSLLPLSQREGFLIPGRIARAHTDDYVHDGYFVFQDEETELYGIMDVYGKVIYPARYNYISFEAFYDGYIILEEDGYTQVVDIAGNTVIPKKKQSGYDCSYLEKGFFAMRGGLYHGSTFIGAAAQILGDYEFFVLQTEGEKDYIDYYEVVDINGKTIFSYDDSYYDKIHYKNGSFVLTQEEDYYGWCDGAAFYDINGNKTFELDKDYYIDIDGESLYDIKKFSAQKYGLVSSEGVIAEPIYQNAYVYHKNGVALGVCEYGDQYCFYTEAGIFFDFDSGYTLAQLFDDYILMGNETSLHLYDTTKSLVLDLGKIYQDLGATDLSSGNCRVIGNLYVMRSDKTYVYNKVTKEAYIEENGYDAYVSGSQKFLYDGTQVVDAFEVDRETVYLAENGKYGYVSAYYSDISPAIYDTPEDAAEYGRDYFYDKSYALTPVVQIGYSVLRDEKTDKPYIAYGSASTGYVPVIQYYQKPFYYDNIEHSGFGNYFVCTFGEEQYLICAG